MVDPMMKALDAAKIAMPYRIVGKQFAVLVMFLKRRAKGKNKEAQSII